MGDRQMLSRWRPWTHDAKWAERDSGAWSFRDVGSFRMVACVDGRWHILQDGRVDDLRLTLPGFPGAVVAGGRCVGDRREVDAQTVAETCLSSIASQMARSAKFISRGRSRTRTCSAPSIPRTGTSTATCRARALRVRISRQNANAAR